MKIILLHDIARLGKRGEMKEVADGYALHFLFPKNLACQATPTAVMEIANTQKEITKAKKQTAATLEAFCQSLEGKTIRLMKRADAKGNLYAKVGARDIVSALKNEKVSVPRELHRDAFEFPQSIKKVGTYGVTIRAGERAFTFKIEVAYALPNAF